jgi:hypothetical protein
MPSEVLTNLAGKAFAERRKFLIKICRILSAKNSVFLGGN